jgi:ribosomal protein S18 acetylase RimI-like enzyme
MAKSGDIHVHWLSLTQKGPVPARLDENGDIDPHVLREGTSVIAAMQNRSTLAMAGVVARNQKISVTVPDISIATAGTSRRIADDPWRLIIRAIRQCAIKLGLKSLEFLLPDENAPGLESLCRSMQRSGLQCRARFAIWQLSSDSATPARPAAGHSIQGVPVRSMIHTPDGRRRCTELLTAILADSSDLIQLPTPQPDALLDDWDASDGLLFLESDAAERLVGICCSVPGESPGAAGNANGLEIHFVGVLPALRNQGCGHRLLAATAEFAHSIPAQSSIAPPMQLTACVDADNKPAIRLYQRAGFSFQRPFQLWLDSRLGAGSGVSFTNEG